MKKVYLLLQNGKVFEGFAFGAEIESVGELVFNTGVVGVIETLTDPAYYGQIGIFTFPLIGNYGIIESDFQSNACHMRGVVVREWCDAPSNFRSQYDLDSFLKAQGVPGIYGVDTRELTRIIRDSGVMNACITYSPEKPSNLDSFSVTDAVKSVSPCEKSVSNATNPKHSVAMIDYGATHGIPEILMSRGVSVTVYPPSVTAKEILSSDFDGIVLGDGPGDPTENTDAIKEISKLFGKKPIFGISLGHQLLALSQGARTEKLKYGHRGSNQPVLDLSNGKSIYITTQNHGYCVTSSSVTSGNIRYTNANDSTCEGIDYENAFSVQFIPDAYEGPRDTAVLFDRFISMMGGEPNAD